MSDIDIRITGHAGRITLTRPKALNALSYDMAMAIEAALDAWAGDDRVKLIVMDAEGDKAFCAGGDIAEIYKTGTAGDYDYGRRFWRDEYRMNAKMFTFPKPVVSLMQGFTMGGGVGIGCHGSHRVVCDSSRLSMPECGIGLIPDVGGTLLLSRAPGRLGEYLGTTGFRMGPADAILAGFADYYVPKDNWPALIATLEETGDWQAVDRAATAPPDGKLAAMQADIDRNFGGETIADILRALAHDTSDVAALARDQLAKGSPLSMACTVEMLHRLRGIDTIQAALSQEFRFTYRALEKSDFLEGVRAAIIDKDRAPKWSHSDASAVPGMLVTTMLMPLGANELVWEDAQ
ncbi:enoyl-CoA hydratase [Actibacterium mucosum KCTC 23349]|uniref:3-hydroxyisobutyryl-CoA hydrolase n=1 Tax=Actibacterium mucosum KCTC 23349 TaxID=1454373 RepID=A0A037ZI58_9RHOB|nr:enoyl-CoA hydratase/isomerase family protein [Actibacterium mucosum]KAJ54485.1 enoyl-CoA hydratase [Actibacterium mucosum KCTC 23349]